MELIKYVNSGSIRSLRPVLEEWVRVVAKYLDFDNGDNPWWYNERTSLSFLAAAAWGKNGIALEEYCTEKGKKDNAYSGRCDLFLGVGSQCFGCEAKQAWCAIGTPARKGTMEAEARLKDACADARTLARAEGRRLGLCFAVPYLPERHKDQIEKLLTAWLREIQNLNYNCIAWTFPRLSRYHTHEGQLYPGLVLLAKEP
ncbi:MAG: hypothetical protein ABSH25_21180 [Syntrophorhabdales bacterium]|jgi:hypothetical protein